jgi:hypothetical protein
MHPPHIKLTVVKFFAGERSLPIQAAAALRSAIPETPMRFALAAALCLLASPALAEAVTYRGDLNGLAIVLELSEPAEAATPELVGRYFYQSEGVDIPLHARAVASGHLELAEEAACEGDDCEIEPNGLITPRVPTAIWSLDIAGNGARLTGTWGPEGSKLVPITLERTGTRPFVPYDPPSPADLAEYSLYLLGGEGPPTRDSSPYDFLKVHGPVSHSGKTRWGNVEFDYVTDPRTLFAYPRITDTGSGARAPANDFLEQRDWGMRLAALNCRSQIYLGMSMGGQVPIEGGSLGGFDEEVIEVHYLSPKLLSFTESGSLFCGNAHPYNHATPFNIDVQTGQPIDLSRVFKGWIASDFASGETIDIETARADPGNYHWGADLALADFIIAQHPSLGSAEIDEECGYPDLVRTNLSIRFAMPDQVIFGLDDLPHVLGACAQDLYDAPIGELRDLLLPEANTYFPGVMD